LLLTSRKLETAFTNKCFESVGEEFFVLDKTEYVGLTATGHEALFPFIFGKMFEISAIENVITDRSRKEDGLLTHNSELLLMVPPVVSFPQIGTIVKYAAFDGIVEVFNQGNNG
jgi:hypothetical protein